MMNQKGVVSLDYLFAFVLVGGFSFLIFALSLSLSMVEVVQYMTFAAARNYYAGHLNEDAQRVRGQLKFDELQANPVLAPLFTNGWFVLDRPTLLIGSVEQSPNPDFAQYKGQPEMYDLFHGAVINFTMKALDFRVPFFGSTSTSEQNGRQKPFSAYIGSYLGRETSFQECENFMIDRWAAIKALPNNFNAAPYSQVNSAAKYVPSDNGC